MRLAGKTALIAGASRNIGRTIALTFARDGANVVPLASRMSGELEQVARECEAFGVKAPPVAADIGDHEQVNRAAGLALERFGNVEILVHVAAIRPHKPFWETGYDEWHQVLGVNLHSLFYLARALVPAMIKNAKGGSMRFARLLAGFLALGLTAAAVAQDYPRRPVRLVTAEPGGGNDFAARVIVQGIGGDLGQPVIVDNRGGAGGLIAADIVAKAQPDGHTLLLYANNVWIIPLLQRSAPFDAVRDFAPITWAAKSSNTLVVHPSLPVKSVQELIAYAKARPGELNYGSGGNGSSTHLAVELFKSMAGVNIVRVTFKGNGPALNALFGGEVHMMITTAGSVTPHLKSGRLRALAVTSPQPSPLAPGLPTMAASGLPGYQSLQIYSVFAPARTPAAIVRRLNDEIVRVLARADVKEKFLANGMEPVGSTPQELAATMQSEIVRIGKVIKDSGIRGD